MSVWGGLERRGVMWMIAVCACMCVWSDGKVYRAVVGQV